MAEPTLICPNCGTEIKLTESLAAPLVASARADYERKLADKDAAAAIREKAIRDREDAVRRAQETVDAQVAERLRVDRQKIAAEESQKATRAAAADLDKQKAETAALQQALTQNNAKLADAQKAQADLLIKQRELDDARREMALTIQKQVQSELAAVRDKAQSEARESLTVKLADMKRQWEDDQKKAAAASTEELARRAVELASLRQALTDNNAKLADAQKAQADLLIKQRELDDARREMALTIQKQVQSELAAVREKARLEAEESARLKVNEKELKLAEKDQTIAAMKKQLEDAQRRAEQGSQQLQGEVLELQLESALRLRFPHDRIDPVPKGDFGGDVLHTVCGPAGLPCGTILWESKRTKNWTDSWLPKLRDDQRAAKAEIAILISAVLPKSVETFGIEGGIWIADPRYAVPLALVLRQSLLELAAARQAGEGQATKTELVYKYLTGTQFRQRFMAIVEKYTDMSKDLAKERKFMNNLWAKREMQILGVLESTHGMYGDLQGIIGKALQEIDGLEVKMLDPPSATN